MSIKTSCTHCGVSFKAADSQAGITGKCPKCGQPVTVPWPDPPPVQVPPVARPPIPPPVAAVAPPAPRVVPQIAVASPVQKRMNSKIKPLFVIVPVLGLAAIVLCCGGLAFLWKAGSASSAAQDAADDAALREIATRASRYRIGELSGGEQMGRFASPPKLVVRGVSVSRFEYQSAEMITVRQRDGFKAPDVRFVDRIGHKAQVDVAAGLNTYGEEIVFHVLLEKAEGGAWKVRHCECSVGWQLGRVGTEKRPEKKIEEEMIEVEDQPGVVIRRPRMANDVDKDWKAIEDESRRELEHREAGYRFARKEAKKHIQDRELNAGSDAWRQPVVEDNGDWMFEGSILCRSSQDKAVTHYWIVIVRPDGARDQKRFTTMMIRIDDTTVLSGKGYESWRD